VWQKQFQIEKLKISNGCKTIAGDGAESVEVPQRIKTLRG
jgi:hypothetical protein